MIKNLLGGHFIFGAHGLHLKCANVSKSEICPIEDAPPTDVPLLMDIHLPCRRSA